MVTQAKAEVAAHADQSEQDYNVQKLVLKQTKALQVFSFSLCVMKFNKSTHLFIFIPSQNCFTSA